MEVFSFAASFESIFISQSFITDFLSQPLLTELFENTVSPGLALPRFVIHATTYAEVQQDTRILSCGTVALWAPPQLLPV